MALRHCAVCDLDFPPYSAVACSVCGADTDFDGNGTLDSSWIQRMETAKKRREEGIPADSEREKVLSWRRLELERAGYADDENIEILAQSTADLRRAADLLRKGCPEHLAVLILA